MKKILFQNDKNIYKANLHCHTTVSDGRHTPQEIKEMYKARGYSVIAFSDHDKLVSQSHLNDDNFLAINSLEVGLGQPETSIPGVKKRVYHFNLLALDPAMHKTPPLMQMDYYDTDAVNDYIQARTNEGYLVSYNHPYWSMQTYEEYAKLEGLFAMEIYNHGCEVGDGYYGYNPQVYDEMLRANGRLYCIATDDNHNICEDSFGGYVMINAAGLTYSCIIDALKAGDFYSSQGPEIYEISIDDKKLKVKCSGVELIVVYTDSRIGYSKKGTNIQEAEFDLQGTERYVRIMCKDEKGHGGFSNAYWL